LSYSPQHQLELLNTLSAQFAGNEYRLLIIDSIMACFRVDYCGRGELADRQQKLNQFLSKLTHMAEEFNVCVLMVRIRNDQIPSTLAAPNSGATVRISEYGESDVDMCFPDKSSAERPRSQRPFRWG
jgi:RecA/RadA recombinase